jgi:hypothetical protein
LKPFSSGETWIRVTVILKLHMCFCGNIDNKPHVTGIESLTQKMLKTSWDISYASALLFSLDFKFVATFKKGMDEAII